MKFDTILDKSFKIKWEVENVNKEKVKKIYMSLLKLFFFSPGINHLNFLKLSQGQIHHFLVEVWESVIEWGQQKYQVANFDMINPSLRDIHVWREIKPLTRYDIWVWMKVRLFDIIYDLNLIKNHR